VVVGYRRSNVNAVVPGAPSTAIRGGVWNRHLPYSADLPAEAADNIALIKQGVLVALCAGGGSCVCRLYAELRACAHMADAELQCAWCGVVWCGVLSSGAVLFTCAGGTCCIPIFVRIDPPPPCRRFKSSPLPASTFTLPCLTTHIRHRFRVSMLATSSYAHTSQFPECTIAYTCITQSVITLGRISRLNECVSVQHE
jgi:hypothetical protein